MSAIENLGGFVVSDAHGHSPAPNAYLAPPTAPIQPIDTNNTFPHLSPDMEYASEGSTMVSQPGLLGPNYPDYAPPSYYDSVTSPAPSTLSTMSPTGKGDLARNQSVSGGAGPATPQSSQPLQYPIAYSAPTSPQLSKETGPSQPSQSLQLSATSGALVRAASAGPSQQPSLIEQAKARLNPRDPPDPPPPCFSRIIFAPSSIITYEPLRKPYVIHGKPGKRFLDEAFATTGVPAFYKHDVEVDDWVRLLEDIQIVARLKGGQRLIAGALPITMHIGFAGFFVSRAIEKGMKRKNAANVADLLDIWNERFFNHRRLNIILCKGDYRESGVDRDLPAPDRPNARPRQKSRRDSSSSDSSSDSEDDEHQRHLSGQPMNNRREMKRQRREQRRTRRDERRADRSTRRAEKKTRNRESYRLVVVSIN